VTWAAIADAFGSPRCDRCGGRRVSVSEWLAMSAEQLQALLAKMEARLAAADTLQPGDPTPDEVTCSCESPDTLVTALAIRHATELPAGVVRLALPPGASSLARLDLDRGGAS
jgi:predicted Fe-S protein YdhL (DUF1289 family)